MFNALSEHLAPRDTGPSLPALFFFPLFFFRAFFFFLFARVASLSLYTALHARFRATFASGLIVRILRTRDYSASNHRWGWMVKYANYRIEQRLCVSRVGTRDVFRRSCRELKNKTYTFNPLLTLCFTMLFSNFLRQT